MNELRKCPFWQCECIKDRCMAYQGLSSKSEIIGGNMEGKLMVLVKNYGYCRAFDVELWSEYNLS